MEQCDECGFIWDMVVSAELPSRLAEAGAAYRRLLLPLDRPADWAERLRSRPAPEVWAPIEYLCHVRDVVLVQRDRFYRGLVEHEPSFPPMWREERAVLGAYADEDAGEVVSQLEMASNLFARAVAAVGTTMLERTCVYSYPEPAVRTLRWLGAQTLHEIEHHLRDIAGVVAPHELGVDRVRRSPVGIGRVELIVSRPSVDARAVLASATFDVTVGLVGDSWKDRPSRRTPDRTPHPDAQVTLMNSRAAELVAGARERWPLAGDQLYVDLDLSETSLPAGTRLAAGGAVFEVTAEPHRGCKKFSERFGPEALRLVNSAAGRELRLRGVNAKVLVPGTVAQGDEIRRL